MRSLPDTHSQAWARRHGACLDGRKALGGKSIRAHWKQLSDPDDVYQLLWIAIRLGRDNIRNNTPEECALKERYNLALDNAYEAGRKRAYRAERTRNRFTSIMIHYGIKWPTEIL